MTLTINLTPEEEAWLRERAERAGRAPHELAHDLLRSHIPVGVDRSGDTELLPVLDEHGIFHQDRWDAVMAYFRESSHGLPVLPDEELTREAMYRDHD